MEWSRGEPDRGLCHGRRPLHGQPRTGSEDGRARHVRPFRGIYSHALCSYSAIIKTNHFSLKELNKQNDMFNRKNCSSARSSFWRHTQFLQIQTCSITFITRTLTIINYMLFKHVSYKATSNIKMFTSMFN